MEKRYSVGVYPKMTMWTL